MSLRKHYDELRKAVTVTKMYIYVFCSRYDMKSYLHIIYAIMGWGMMAITIWRDDGPLPISAYINEVMEHVCT